MNIKPCLHTAGCYIIKSCSCANCREWWNAQADAAGLHHDRVHKDVGNARPAKTVRTAREVAKELGCSSETTDAIDVLTGKRFSNE